MNHVCDSIAEAGEMTQILLFLVVFAKVAELVGNLERIIVNPFDNAEKGKEESEEAEENAAADYEAQTAYDEMISLIDKLNKLRILPSALSFIVQEIPFTSQSSKSRVILEFQHEHIASIPCIGPASSAA